MKRKKLLFFMIATGIGLIIIAAFPRAIEVAAGNYLFGYDQGKHWLGAKAIVVDHKFPLIGDEVGGGGGFFQGAGWYYLQAIPFVLFKGDPYGQLILVFILGILTVLVSYILFSKRFGMREGLSIALLVALSPSISIQSRFAWPPFVISFLTIFYLDALFLVIKKKRYAWFYLFFIIGAMTHFEIATAASLGAVTFIFLICAVRIRLSSLIEGCIGGFIPMMPLLVFDLRHQLLNIKGVYRMLTTVVPSSSVNTFSKIISNHLGLFSENLFGTFPSLPFPSVYILIGAGMTILLLLDKEEKKELQKYLISLYIIPFLLFIGFLTYKKTLWSWWILELPIFYCVIMGLLLGYIGRKFRLGTVVCVVFFLMLIWVSVPTIITTWKRDYSDYGGTQKIRGRKDAIDAIFQDARGSPFGALVYAPPIYTYPYDFLFWWIGTNTYHYVPYNEKRGIFYLLIEPYETEPWRHKGWLETVIKDGTVLFTQELPSGFIIQKRMAQ